MGDSPILARLAVAALGAVTVCLPAGDPAQARSLTAVSPSGKRVGGSFQRWIDQAKVPTVPGRVRIVLSGCPGQPRLAGCVYTRRLRTIYLQRHTPHPREVFYHELGHLFDFRLMSRGERRLYKRLVGQRRRGWFRGVNPPAEQFAEAYSLCARKLRIAGTALGHYDFRSSPRRHAAACALIRRAAGPSARPQPPRAPVVVSEPTRPGAEAPPQAEPPQQEDESLLEKLVPG